ncbi:MAG: hypothetical protein R3Y63_10280 [Eubacteriales bacterium]
MNEYQAILDQGYTNVTLDKKVSEAFSPRVKEYLETLGFSNLSSVTLSQNLVDGNRWQVYIYDTCLPYSYFPRTDNLVLNYELDNPTHKERYTIIRDEFLGQPIEDDFPLLAALYLLSADTLVFQVCQKYVYTTGIDFESLRKNPCLDMLDIPHFVFVDTAESLYTSSLECAVLPIDIIRLSKDKMEQFYNGLLIATGEKVEDVDSSFMIKIEKEVN